ncbi:MAG: NUDIX hydrolase [Pirellulales bacterium]
MHKVPSNGRHGVVAIVVESDRYLAIRRSAMVRAPRMICFPGGGIEPNESFEEAIRREMKEELDLEVEVVAHVWTSRTSWGTDLEWMLVRRTNAQEPKANPREVEEIFWLSREELLGHPDLLGSVPDFFAALETSQVLLDRQQ